MIVEISFMFILILGHATVPKGNISHKALSQLLLVYLSLASDILDLLTLLNEQEIYNSLSMTHSVLIIFSLCMFQFALNLTVTRGRAFYAEFDEPEITMHQSAPRSKSFLDKFISQKKSLSTTRPLTTIVNPHTIRPKPRASSFSIVNPPDTIFENRDANRDYEMQVNKITSISKPTFIAVDPPARSTRDHL